MLSGNQCSLESLGMGTRSGFISIWCRASILVAALASLSELCQSLESPKHKVEFPAKGWDGLPQFEKLGKGASKPTSTPQPKKKKDKENIKNAEDDQSEEEEEDLPVKPKPKCHWPVMSYGDYGNYGFYDYTESRRRRRRRRNRRRHRDVTGTQHVRPVVDLEMK